MALPCKDIRVLPLILTGFRKTISVDGFIRPLFHRVTGATVAARDVETKLAL